MRAEQFIIGKSGILQPKKGEKDARKVTVFDVKASQNGLLLEVCDADKAEHTRDCGKSHAWVMAYRVCRKIRFSCLAWNARRYDFCDANVVMAEAFEELFKVDPADGSLLNDNNALAVWNGAWDKAKAEQFFQEAQ